MHNVLTDAANCIAQLQEQQGLVQSLADLIAENLKQNQLRGSLFISAVGKPGYVAQKCAATLQSLDIDGAFICPMLAGHGDLGAIPLNKHSLLICMSKSGKSAELALLLANVKSARPLCKTVMISMSGDSSSAIQADVNLAFSLDTKELDGYGLLPSVSNAMFELVLSQAISNALSDTMTTIQVCERLELCHPSGSLHDKAVSIINSLTDAN